MNFFLQPNETPDTVLEPSPVGAFGSAFAVGHVFCRALYSLLNVLS